ncbi:hypothetical protein GH714_024735 [Hevea brasiliensis]|uniref:Shikimate dehydrogenase substrate binding N-terminal domain-containing protein n=1 Tax=Hevea brasiliensis TaxID=3981 RepID=A0A6A6M039_HEVBR|nr:hypothetical protein GH714_024735 [Hevea brasiliensis]
MEDNISSELKLSDLRRQTFRRTIDQLQDRASSILLLTLQWKDIEDHFASAHNAIEQRAVEVDSIQESVQQTMEDVKERERELELVQEYVKERFREIEAKEKDFELNQRKEIEESKREIERIEKSGRELELKLREIRDAEKKLELFNDSIEKRAAEVREILSETEVKEKECERFFNELKLKKEQIEEHCKELALKEENFSRRILEFEAKEKKFEEKYEEFRVKDEKIDGKFNDLELKEKLIKARCEKVESEKKKFMERCKEFEEKKRQFEKQCRELEMKEKHFVHGHTIRVKIEPPNTSVVDNAVDYPNANLHFSVNMDGKALQIFLNEHRGEYDSMRNEVLVALGFSSDPAKLVLDAMQGFFPPHLKKGDMEFEEEVVRRSCILLLEQLMKISPEIRPHVKKEAMRLAFDWRTKIKGDAGHSLEVLGFLQLLASYGLVSAFDADDLLTQLEIVAKHRQSPELFRVLGFAEKISGFIQNLIRKKQHVEAIRFIYAFELVNEFPPVPLLNDYLKGSKSAAKKFRKGNKSLEGQTEATNKRIADLSCAVRCIEEFNIEFGPSLGNLKHLIDVMERQISNRKTKVAALACKKRRNRKKRLPPNYAALDAPVLAPKSASTTSVALTSFPSTTSNSVPFPKTRSQQLSGSKRSWTDMSPKDLPNSCSGADQANRFDPFHAKTQQSSLGDSPLESKEASSSLDPQHKPKAFSFNRSKEDLKLLLKKHEDNDLEHGEIAAALRLACDPGRLVLDVMNASHPFNLKRNEDIKLRVSKKLYLIAGAVKDDKLLVLLDADEWRKEAADLVQVLGLADKIPNFIQNLIKKEQPIEAVKYIYALDMVDKFPPVPILKDYLSNSSKKNVKQLSRKKRKSNGGQIQAIVKESGKKRPRIHVSSEDPPKASIRGTPVVHSMQPPQQHPPGFVATQGAPYMYPPPRHYSLAGYPPNNMQFDSYNSNFTMSDLQLGFKEVQSSPTLLCTPLMGTTVDQMLIEMQRAKEIGADVVEIRIDCLKNLNPRQDLEILIKQSPLPTLVTYRSLWLPISMKLGKERVSPVVIVNMKLDSYASHILQVAYDFNNSISRSKPDNFKVIVSSHNFHNTPSAEAIASLVARIQATGADIVKIATTALDITDCARIFQIMVHSQVPIIGIAMGERGLISRLLSPKFGGFLSYGALEAGAISAPGQPTAKDMLDLYNFRLMRPDTKVYGIIGKPVGHSKSPLLFNASFKSVGLNAVYMHFLVDDVEKFFNTYSSVDFTSGCSCTIPIRKLHSNAWMKLTPLPRRPGDGKLIGYNTDSEASLTAMEDALKEQGYINSRTSFSSSLTGRQFVLVGAGGAGRALAFGAKSRGARVIIFDVDFDVGRVETLRKPWHMTEKQRQARRLVIDKLRSPAGCWRREGAIRMHGVGLGC